MCVIVCIKAADEEEEAKRLFHVGVERHFKLYARRKYAYYVFREVLMRSRHIQGFLSGLSIS